MKVLIIEDEKALAESIESYLSDSWLICHTVNTLHEAMAKIAYNSYDCIVLDLMLPDGDGLKILENLRNSMRMDGVIIISAKGALNTRIEGLNLGADDFLTKPFHMAELLARIQAVVRRKTVNPNSVLEFNEITVDLNAKKIHIHQKEVDFTRKEYELILYLLGNKNKVVSRGTLAQHLSGDLADMLESHDFVYTHIKNIKRKLHESGCIDYIKTLYGVGYKWVE